MENTWKDSSGRESTYSMVEKVSVLDNWETRVCKV